MSDTQEQTNGSARQHKNRATSLDIENSEMRELAAYTVALVTDYFANLPELPVFPKTSAGELTEALGSSLPIEGDNLERVIDNCRTIIAASRHNGHPRFFGYVASPATPMGAFADVIASALNQNVTSWRSAPAATEVERTVVRWLALLVGYPEDAGGLLTSGGSMANLNALFIAHRAKSPGEASLRGLWNAGPPMTIYVSDQVHLSIPKAADIMGLGREQVRIVETDEHFRVDVRRLRERIESDAQNGLQPFCIVASAGTVNTGAIDPLMEISRVAAEHKLWFHVDGAYGALAAVDLEKRSLFAGIERADSLSLDPHKWLYAPVDCGCLLFRDMAQARAAFRSTEAEYIKVYTEQTAESFAFWDFGVELSRRFRALKIWMMLRYYGARRIAAAISEDNALAQYFAERVSAADDFELLAPVTLSICCFRYVPPDMRGALAAVSEDRDRIEAHLDELNMRIMQVVQRGGRAYLSNAALHGRFALRACITNFRTTRKDIDETLDVVRDAARHC